MPAMKKTWAHYLLFCLGILLIVAALLQLNDDFPWLWGGIYSTTGIACLFVAKGKVSSWLIGGWAILLLIGVVWQYLREAEPCWKNLGCMIGSDVPGLVLNAVVASGLFLYCKKSKNKAASRLETR